MIQEIHNIFPNLTEQKIWKILLTVKARYKKHGTIGISRLEATRFGTSERQLQAFIKYLRETQAIKKVKMATASNGFKCNVYKLASWFIEGLEEVKDYVRKVFKYIDPVQYVKERFITKKKGNKIKFKVNGNRYIIHLTGNFKGVIYDVGNSCIINPLKLGN